MGVSIKLYMDIHGAACRLPAVTRLTAPAGRGSYRVAGMAETDIETTSLAPKALVGEIERTRANLAETIDEIADRVSPSNVARRTADRAGADRPD